MHTLRLIRANAVLAALSALLATGCDDEEKAGTTFYERQVAPILLQSCRMSGGGGGCHAANADDPFSFAAGNFDVTSFENVQKRRDVLQAFGGYSIPLLLIKAVGGTDELEVAYDGQSYTLEVNHAGGSNLQVGSPAYLTLLQWMENGATENGLPPPAPPQRGQGNCSSVIPGDFDPAPFQSDPNFSEFTNNVQPVLEACSTASCHGAQQSDFYITCGSDTAQQAWNFKQVQSFIDDPVEDSQILRVPLAVNAGGFFHTGGEHFTSRTDPDYEALRTWAEKVGEVRFGDGDPGKEFFATHVQPLLLRRGCGFMACHSPSSTNDFKLRSGSQGFFSAVALERNYELMTKDFMALEVPDARRSRVVAKTILASGGGIEHRGGPVLETQGAGAADPADCDQPVDLATASAFCIIQEWVRIEREKLIEQGLALPLGQAGGSSDVPIVYVEREESHVASLLEFDTYQPSSDLLVATATLDAQGSIATVGAPRSLLDGCPGADNRATVDVRSPDVRFDGDTVAFAMRTSQGDPLGIYTVSITNGNCQRITPAEPDAAGIKIHNFDPAWSPDGEYIVFASTRGGAGGPSVSRRLFLPQSDIWRMRADGSQPEQVTFLTNSEIGPQMMREGRITMTTEKISAGFYQLAGRRINWDRTDYHPLLAQRAESPFADLFSSETPDLNLAAPSVGYAQATEIREGFDGNFLFILSDSGARGGAGTLAIFNRSVGTFEQDRDDPGFLKSMRIPDTNATGRVGAATNGAYRSPFSLPDGRIMASYAGYSGDLGTATSLAWDIVAVNSRTGQRTPIIDGPGAQVEAVLAIKHSPRTLYANRRQLVFGGEINPGAAGGEDAAVIHFPDAPLIFTLLNANLRRGRPVEQFRSGTQVAVYLEQPAPPTTSSGAGEGGIYESRELLGRAPLAGDGSVRVRVPAGVGLVFELQDDDGNPVQIMREEHQVAPGEVINLGISERLFDQACGGCHGSVSGKELDIFITPDVLTGASESSSANDEPYSLTN